MAREVEIGGSLYTVSKLPNAIKQMHIMRRILPLLSGMTGVDTTDSIKSIFENIGSIKDEDFEYILFGLLENVKKKDTVSGLWVSLTSGNTLMFQDIDLMTLLDIAKESAMENFAFLGNALAPK